MKEVLIVLIALLIYAVFIIITTALAMYLDRTSGFSAKEVYSEFGEYVMVGVLCPVSFPIILGMVVFSKLKVLLIAIVETRVVTKDKENTDD